MLAAAVAAFVLTACSDADDVPPAASPEVDPVASVPASTAPARDQLALGAEFYSASCARCHGAAGEGDIGPALIGENYVFRSRGTAQGLYDYVSETMPFDAPGSLPEQEYWDILAWVLDENALLPDETELGSENAADVNVNP